VLPVGSGRLLQTCNSVSSLTKSSVSVEDCIIDYIISQEIDCSPGKVSRIRIHIQKCSRIFVVRCFVHEPGHGIYAVSRLARYMWTHQDKYSGKHLREL
jgi:hypothetical protein